ncbi:MAG: hypothetical protein U0869_09740 [Chloroflexota bacterium]
MDDTGQPGTDPGTGAGSGRLDIQGMLNQLQGMIGKVAHASEPALREVAAKAAELAAVAADRAGPIAHQLADKTDEVSQVVAEKAGAFATSLRSPAQGAPGPAPDTGEPPVSDPAEESPQDGA